MGASINYGDKQGGGRGSPKCQRYYISLFSKLVNKNPQNSVNVVYGYPLYQNFTSNLNQLQRAWGPCNV